MAARSPESMALCAGGFGIAAVAGGMALSYWADTPAGPSIVAASATIFAVAALVSIATERQNG